ncbi:MAG TPA: thioether cross-link-forming SCIFF peptide maturase [Eubacteriales bacterium]|nr:thioether cross-link-forming SCIFF peptide maturase [Eubacteriales bacterium]
MHWFTCCGEYFLYDVESGSLHSVDKIIYDILEGKTEGYTAEDLSDAKAEMDELKKLGLIDAPAPKVDNLILGDEVKSICLHLSHDCNLRCKYCFAGQGAYHGERMNMPIEVAKAAVDFLIEKSGNRHTLEIDFFGGEPLMNMQVMKDTVNYIEEQCKIHNKKFKLTTTTNGILLSKEISDYLNEKMDNVVMSVDGRKSVHDNARPTPNGKGSFDLIIDKFKYFRSIRGNKDYFIRGTFTHDNLDFSKDVLYINELGFDQISMEPVVLPESNPMAITEKDLPGLLAEYETLVSEYISRRKDKSSWFSFFHFLVELENGPCYKKRLVGCGAGGEYLAVTPDGNIYPCHQFAGEKDYLIGNVFDKKLNEDIRNIFKNSNLMTKSACKNCWARYHCSGGCNANAIHYNGDINKPYNLACALVKKRLECALYVYAKEFGEIY